MWNDNLKRLSVKQKKRKQQRNFFNHLWSLFIIFSCCLNMNLSFIREGKLDLSHRVGSLWRLFFYYCEVTTKPWYYQSPLHIDWRVMLLFKTIKTLCHMRDFLWPWGMCWKLINYDVCEFVVRWEMCVRKIKIAQPSADVEADTFGYLTVTFISQFYHRDNYLFKSNSLWEKERVNRYIIKLLRCNNTFFSYNAQYKLLRIITSCVEIVSFFRVFCRKSTKLFSMCNEHLSLSRAFTHYQISRKKMLKLCHHSTLCWWWWFFLGSRQFEYIWCDINFFFTSSEQYKEVLWFVKLDRGLKNYDVCVTIYIYVFRFMHHSTEDAKSHQTCKISML